MHYQLGDNKIVKLGGVLYFFFMEKIDLKNANVSEKKLSVQVQFV